MRVRDQTRLLAMQFRSRRETSAHYVTNERGGALRGAPGGTFLFRSHDGPGYDGISDLGAWVYGVSP